MSTKPDLYTVPERVRRKLAADYRREADNPKRKKADRAEFARMADAWERTLPKPGK
jgi:hypothetical protein